MTIVIICLVIFLILFFILINLLEEQENAKKNDLKEIEIDTNKSKNLYEKIIEDTSCDIGEWEKEVRKDMKAIVSVENKYKCNKEINILVGDYNRESVSNTTCVLESMGINVRIAKTGLEIIKRIKNGEKYDLIITNNIYANSNLDGFSTLQYLKNLDKFNIPVIVLTTSEGKRNFFINSCGFDEYMTKLLTQEKVLNTIPKVIENIEFTKIM